MKILMMAYACEPDAGGEPSVGWYWAENAARYGHKVTVVTRKNNKPSINGRLSELSPEIRANISFLYHDLRGPMLRWKKKAGVFSMLGYYYLWQLAAVPKLRRYVRSNRTDLLHHVTFCNDSVFSALALLPGTFLWGPTGGYSHKIRGGLFRSLAREARRYERRRAMLQFVLRYLDPLAHLSRRRAATVLLYSKESQRSYSRLMRRRTRTITHVGVDEAALRDECSIEASAISSPLRVVSVGRLVHWKGFDLTIEAVALAAAAGVDLKLTVIGAGPEEEILRGLALKSGAGHLVDFTGRLPNHRDVTATVSGSDVFLQPTLRDGPPVAIIEAMAAGTMVITADYGANAEVVPPDCGIVVAPSDDRSELVQSLANSLIYAASNRDVVRERSIAGVRHIREHRTWQAIGRHQDRLYRELGERGLISGVE